MQVTGMKTICRDLAATVLLAGLAPASLLHAENLYSEGSYQSFVADKKAFRVGDALTIIILENAQAKSASDRKVGRDYGLSGDINAGSLTDEATLNLGVDRAAGDVTQRAGTLKAAMTVAVKSIDEAGNLHVEGSQRIALDGEEQLISVSGTIRPVDVGTDNTVPSPRLLDAKIAYNGYPVADDGKKRNWVYRFLNTIGVF